MDHPKDFRSTVLQAPSRHDDRDDDRDRDRRRHRDIMNPAPGSTRHSGFNLRSPTQSEYHHPPHSSYSSPKAASSTSHALPHHSPRSHQSGLSHPNPYSSSTAAGGPLAPSLPALGGASSSSGAGHHQAPPLSPLHPPSGYYPPPESHQTREKPATSSYYDPLTDTTRERRVSDAGWNNNAANGSLKIFLVATLVGAGVGVGGCAYAVFVPFAPFPPSGFSETMVWRGCSGAPQA
ncbi:hypothetical protein CCUS01_05730 [Colletotrichum cuscutae]|uniref:Uncharacterized protein n=1 Tax=Colletotrichum cuscutae TaxID=1209917 RepID=A0AAI9Y5M1_9PEZI|nr:hypothetical protein CCUS01_05730 [Colletotrichum cuscutae]